MYCVGSRQVKNMFVLGVDKNVNTLTAVKNRINRCPVCTSSVLPSLRSLWDSITDTDVTRVSSTYKVHPGHNSLDEK